ncbi:hypothetical protein RKD26_002122 [Streptomyces calvus]
MSSMTRNRSSRSGMYHSCCRSQLSCQACQSAAAVVVVFASVIEPLPHLRPVIPLKHDRLLPDRTHDHRAPA